MNEILQTALEAGAKVSVGYFRREGLDGPQGRALSDLTSTADGCAVVLAWLTDPSTPFPVEDL